MMRRPNAVRRQQEGLTGDGVDLVSQVSSARFTVNGRQGVRLNGSACAQPMARYGGITAVLVVITPSRAIYESIPRDCGWF